MALRGISKQKLQITFYLILVITGIGRSSSYNRKQYLLPDFEVAVPADPNLLEITARLRQNQLKTDDKMMPSTMTEGSFTPYVERLELVDVNCKTGNMGNNHGGTSPRIIRTPDGILYTAYKVPASYSNPSWPSADFAQQWRLAKRLGDNNWQLIDTDRGYWLTSVLLSAQDYIYVITWSDVDNLPHNWVFDTDGNYLYDYTVPGLWSTGWYAWYPYSDVGIDLEGNLAVIQTLLLYTETPNVPGLIHSYYSVTDSQWHEAKQYTDHQYCYPYVLPSSNGGLSVVNTIDTSWESLGMCKPSWWWHSCVFNQFHRFSRPDLTNTTLADFKVVEVNQTDCEYFVQAMAVDSYVDLSNRLHVIYQYANNTTSATISLKHVIIQNGQIIADVDLPALLGNSARIIQDTQGKFYILGSNTSIIYPAISEDGTVLGGPVGLNFSPYTSDIAMTYIAVPRGGVPVADYLDGAFITTYSNPDQGKWVYFRIRLVDDSLARAPDPGNATDVRAINGELTLNWTVGSTAANHDVYFGLAPESLVYKGRQPETFYSLTNLELNETYYWRIDEVEADGLTTHEGNVWSFTVACFPEFSPDADINEDCYVNFGDLAEIADSWLEFRM